jgi:hypothetical protein
MAKQSTYGRRAARRRKKDQLLTGYVAWPMAEQKALQTFSTSAGRCRAMIKLKTGQEPEAFGWRIVHAEIVLRIFEKRSLLNSNNKLKEAINPNNDQ